MNSDLGISFEEQIKVCALLAKDWAKKNYPSINDIKAKEIITEVFVMGYKDPSNFTADMMLNELRIRFLAQLS